MSSMHNRADLAPVYALVVANERRASDHLAEAGFEVWAPTYQRLRPACSWTLRQVIDRERIASRAASLVETPVFPGYVFARIGLGGFPSAMTCDRVLGILPWPVPQDDFASILILVLSGRLNDRAPGATSKPRGRKSAKLASMQEWFRVAERVTKRAA